MTSLQTLRWEDIPEEQLNARVTRRVVHTETMTVARIGLAKGAIVPLHSHPNEQIMTVNSGRLLVRIGGEEITVKAGQMLPIPGNLPHEVEALEDSVATDLFSPRREDWIRGDDAYLRS